MLLLCHPNSQGKKKTQTRWEDHHDGEKWDVKSCTIEFFGGNNIPLPLSSFTRQHGPRTSCMGNGDGNTMEGNGINDEEKLCERMKNEKSNTEFPTTVSFFLMLFPITMKFLFIFVNLHSLKLTLLNCWIVVC